MVLYLSGGWFTPTQQGRLRDEVVDGAIDTAASLYQTSVPAELVETLAARLGPLSSPDAPAAAKQVAAAPEPDPKEAVALDEAERDGLRLRLLHLTDRAPVLQGFVTDCLEHITSRRDVRAMHLHLVHIGQMMRLLQVTQINHPAASAPHPAAAVTAANPPGAAQPGKKLHLE